jgi:hypothetical protein
VKHGTFLALSAYSRKHLIFFKLMTTHKLIGRRLFCGLPLRLVALAIFTIFTGRPIFAQTGATTLISSAPDPRLVEAQRRQTLSHRRRAQIQQNEQNNRMLMASQESPIADKTRRRPHRAPSMHRSTTRRAVAAAPSPGIGQ